MTIKLSSGREWEIRGAGLYVLGIGADLEVTEGYDHGNQEWDEAEKVDHEWKNEYVTALTKAEMMEVCDLMIDRWQRKKAQIAARTD